MHELIKEMFARHLANDLFAGQYESAFKGQGLEFSEVREYQPGDDVRTIDWNVSARFGHPYIKVFHEERELTVMLLLDLSGSQSFGTKRKFKRELLAEVARRYPDIPRLMLTGYADKANAIKAINDIGLFQYIEKPWDNDNLLIVLRNALERRFLFKKLQEKIAEIDKAEGKLSGLQNDILRTFI